MQLRLPEAEAEMRAAFAAADDRTAGGIGVQYYQRLDLGAILLARGRLEEAREQFALAERGAAQSQDGSPFTNVMQMRAYRAGLEVGIGDVDWSVRTLETALDTPDGVSDRSLIPTFAVLEQLARGSSACGQRGARRSSPRERAAPSCASAGRRRFARSAWHRCWRRFAPFAGMPQAGWDDLARARAAYPLVARDARAASGTDLPPRASRRCAAPARRRVEPRAMAVPDLPAGVEVPAHSRGEALVLAGEARLHAMRPAPARCSRKARRARRASIRRRALARARAQGSRGSGTAGALDLRTGARRTICPQGL